MKAELPSIDGVYLFDMSYWDEVCERVDRVRERMAEGLTLEEAADEEQLTIVGSD